MIDGCYLTCLLCMHRTMKMTGLNRKVSQYRSVSSGTIQLTTHDDSSCSIYAGDSTHNTSLISFPMGNIHCYEVSILQGWD